MKTALPLVINMDTYQRLEFRITNIAGVVVSIL